MSNFERMPLGKFKEINQKQKLLMVFNISYTAIMFLAADSDKGVLK
jgi:hypothetical protein